MLRYVLILSLIVTPALAVEPLASATLLERCSSEQEAKKEACRSWIHGFIGGAFASRTAKETGASRSETFSERATRTRVSRGRNVYGQNYDASYCLPKETTLDDLTDKLTGHAAGLKQVPEYANQLMLGMLRKEYPCSTTSS